MGIIPESAIPHLAEILAEGPDGKGRPLAGVAPKALPAPDTLRVRGSEVYIETLGDGLVARVVRPLSPKTRVSDISAIPPYGAFATFRDERGESAVINLRALQHAVRIIATYRSQGKLPRRLALRVQDYLGPAMEIARRVGLHPSATSTDNLAGLLEDDSDGAGEFTDVQRAYFEGNFLRIDFTNRTELVIPYSKSGTISFGNNASGLGLAFRAGTTTTDILKAPRARMFVLDSARIYDVAAALLEMRPDIHKTLAEMKRSGATPTNIGRVIGEYVASQLGASLYHATTPVGRTK